MKMEFTLTKEEISKIVIEAIARNQSFYAGGDFHLEFLIAAATGQPAIFTGAVVTLEQTK